MEDQKEMPKKTLWGRIKLWGKIGGIATVAVYAAYIIVPLAFPSCSSQSMARKGFGTTTINVPNCRKVLSVTWKDGSSGDSSVWYSHRAFHPNEVPDTVVFEEETVRGILGGKVELVESCKR